MDNQLGNYDVSYQLDGDSVRKALEALVVDPLKMQLASLPLAIALPAPAPPHTVQSGELRPASQPTIMLTMPTAAGGPISLVVSYSSMLLSLQAVPGVVGFAGIGALPPTAAGSLTITLSLMFSSTPSGSSSFVQIASTPAAQVSNLGAMPDLSGLTTIALAGLVNTAVATAVQNALAALLPLPVEVPLGQRGVCGIGPRSLDVKLLPGANGTQPSLGFFLALQDDTHGNLAMATSSVLANGIAGALALSTPFLKKLLCCLFEQGGAINGLGTHTEENCTFNGATNCCCWHDKDNVAIGDKVVHVEDLMLCIIPGENGAPSSIHMHVHATQSGDGWTAHVVVDVDFGLRAKQGSIEAFELVDPMIDTWNELAWWVWAVSLVFAAIGALVGLILGGFAIVPIGAGALAGFGLGLAVSGVIDLVLNGFSDLAAREISGALSTLGAAGTTILPPALADKFGSISDVVDVVFDDLVVGGNVRPPRRDNIVSEGLDLILELGDRVDLDRGVVARAGSIPSGFALEGDLIWRRDPRLIDGLSSTGVLYAARVAPGISAVGPLENAPPPPPPPSSGTLAPLGGARMIAIARSFWSLSESDLEAVAFPTHRGNAIDGSNIIASDSLYPFGATVFAVHTTAGRIAKCVCWRDTHDRLHLSYVTYDTWQPVAIMATWQTTRGPGADVTPIRTRYQVARTGTLVASQTGPNTLIWFPPSAYRWFWNDHQLQGSGTLPDGTTTYAIVDKTCRITTAMGTSLNGILQLERGDGGNAVVATLQIDESGFETEWNLPADVASTMVAVPATDPLPSPQPPRRPVHDQLVEAFARGMNLPVDQVRFR